MRLRKASLAVASSLVATALFSACGSADNRPQLTVGAASSLEPLFRALSDDFGEAHDVEVVLVFSASGTLAHQIEQGAPIDVFASAEPRTVQVAAEHLRSWLEGEGFVGPSSELGDA